MSLPLASVPKLWPGETAALLATGPSLTQADCDYLRGRVKVIAINDAHRLAPWADVLYSSDRRWWSHYKGVPEFAGLKYGIGSSVGKSNPFTKIPGITVLRNGGYEGLDPLPTTLRNGSNSGFAAINLAVHLGATRLLLLGYNMSHVGGKAHFFGNHPAGMNNSAMLYPGFRRRFMRLVEPLKAAGVEVINCTPNTSLEAFPVRKLRDVLPERAVAA